MRYFCTVIFLFLFNSVFSETFTLPNNDDPCNPTLLGSLDTATRCPFSSAVSPLILAGQNNIFATPEFPYPALMGCLGTGNMPSQMKDVWYKFSPSASHLDVYVIGTGNTPLATPVIALYLYTGDCMALTPIRCAVGQSGLLIANFSPLVPGAQYLLQVGGGTATDAGQFTLVLSNSENCLSCSQDAVLFASPAPVNGYYGPNQTVNFCYVLRGYKRYNSNALHGVVPVLGPGWDPTTLTFSTPVQRTSTTAGNWMVYTYNNLPIVGTQKGFFFDAANPVPDGNPTNNRGDAGGLNDEWIFCWQVKTRSCPPVSKILNQAVRIYSDGMTGQGAPAPGCISDSPYHFAAVLNCCGQANVTIQPVTCYDSCNGNITLSLNTSPAFLPPYNYYWYNSSGTNVQTTLSQTSTTNTFSGACRGIYTNITSSNGSPGCFVSQNVEVYAPFYIQSLMQTVYPCVNSSNFASAAVSMAPAGSYIYSWSNGNTTSTATNLQPGILYTVFVTNGTSSCIVKDTIRPVSIPLTNPFFEYPSIYLAKCPGGDTLVNPLYIESPGGAFTCSSNPGIVTSQTGQLHLNYAMVGNSYTITYNSPGPCPSSHSVVVNITGKDTAYFHYPTRKICSARAAPLIPDSVLSYNGYFHVTALSGPANGLNVDSASGVINPVFQPGVYLVIFDSQNPGSCHSVYKDTITVVAQPAAPTIQSIYYYCPGDTSLTMTANSTCITCAIAWCSNTSFSPPNFTGNPYTVNPLTASPVYYLLAYDIITGCPSNLSTVNIQSATMPSVSISASDTTICPGYVCTLHSAVNGSGYSYSWLPSSPLNNPSISDPQFTAAVTTMFTLYVTNLTTNCTGRNQFTVVVDTSRNCSDLILYSGFSPNGDGLNDWWIIDGIALYPKNKVTIFNRWGEKVWQASDYNNRDVVWKGENSQGKALPSGTYYYVIELPNRPSRKGWVELSK